MSEQKSCKQRVGKEWEDRRKDIEEALRSEDGLNELGLSLDLVEAGTFKDQREDYVRYQMSWGGPSDELRFYKNGDIEYWFMDWYDGACIDVTNDKMAQAVRDYFSGCLPEAPWF